MFFSPAKIAAVRAHQEKVEVQEEQEKLEREEERENRSAKRERKAQETQERRETRQRMGKEYSQYCKRSLRHYLLEGHPTKLPGLGTEPQLYSRTADQKSPLKNTAAVVISSR